MINNNVNNSVAAAEHTIGKRVVPKTIKNYMGKLNILKIYLATKSDDSLFDLDGNIALPLPTLLIHDIFGWLSTNTDLPKRNRRSTRRINQPNERQLGNENNELSDSDSEHEAVAEEGTNNAGAVDLFASSEVTVSASCMQGYKSALIWWYAEKKMRLEQAQNDWIDNFIKGYKKIVADKKARGVMSISEGKSALSFSGYLHISKTMMTLRPVNRKYTWMEGIFSWSFMTLSWNLIARANSVGNIMLQHIDWREDSPIVTFPKHKGDQTGEGLGNEKHVYANPVNPECCPILALAIIIFCTHRTSDILTQQLFCGSDSEGRFSRVFQHILSIIPDGVSLGANKKDLGTHSNRKGGSSYVLNWNEVSAVQVYLRAGWTIGNVQDRYIFAGAGGDQLVGRAVSGLPINTGDFAILPPHFKTNDLNSIMSIGWENILEGYENYPQCFRRAVPFFLAAIIFHLDFLRANLPHDHPLWRQRIFSQHLAEGKSVVEYFYGRIITGHGHCTDSNMQATGVPSQLRTAQEVALLRNQVEILQQTQIQLMANFENSIIESVRAIPNAVKNCIMENFVVDGVVPVNMADIQRIVGESSQSIVAQISDIRNVLDGLRGLNNANQPQAQPEVQTNGDTSGEEAIAIDGISRQYFSWGGKLGRLVPFGFKFVSSDVKTTWNIWHYGQSVQFEGASRHTYPLKRLLLKRHRDDLLDSNSKVNLSRASRVIEEIVNIAKRRRLVAEDGNFSLLNKITSDTIFGECFRLLTEELYNGGKPKRPGETMCATIANKMYKKSLA